MKQRSRKIKGRLLSKYVRKKLLKAFPHLKARDILEATDGQNGPDLILSKVAKKLVPFNWELKSQERMATVYKWFAQASKNTKEIPVVVGKMNSRAPLAILDFDNFIELIK